MVVVVQDRLTCPEAAGTAIWDEGQHPLTRSIKLLYLDATFFAIAFHTVYRTAAQRCQKTRLRG